MCTLSWCLAEGSLELFFNRDERRRRAPALPPRQVRDAASGPTYLAPQDAEAGGTWIGVNAWGLAACLLNHYEAESRAEPSLSRAHGDFSTRGLVVRELMTARDPAEAERALRSLLTEQRFRPFSLVALALPEPGMLQSRRLTWDGRQLRRAAGAALSAPISSSSYRGPEVRRSRRTHYARSQAGKPAAASLEAFHRSHEPERGAFSVCMHRPEARTVSLSRVTIGASEVQMRYGAGPACEATLGPPLRLKRAFPAELQA